MAPLLLMLSDFVSLPLSPPPRPCCFSSFCLFSPHLSIHLPSFQPLPPSLPVLCLSLSHLSFTSTVFVSFHLCFYSCPPSSLALLSSIPIFFYSHIFSLSSGPSPLFLRSPSSSILFAPLSLSCPPSHPLLYLCPYPSLPVTIAAVPSIRPRFPVAWLPRSPSRSLAPSLRRTAGRRCTAPPPPSPTGRGNESPRQLRALGVRVCVCESPRTSGVKFDSLRVRQCESVKQPCVSPLTCIVMMYMEYNWTSVLFSVEHSGPECCCGCKMYQCFKLPLQMSHRGPVKRRPAAAVHEMMLLFEGI